MIHCWIKRWRTIRALLHLLLRALLLLLLRWDVPVPTVDASLYFTGESTGNRHRLWTSSPEQRDTRTVFRVMLWPWHKSRACNWTAVVSLLSLICCSMSAFTAAVIFVGRLELGLLSMLFVSLCFCTKLRIPIRPAIKPSSRNMRQIVSGL